MCSEVCIISYNSRGFGCCKQDFIKMFEAITGCLTIICSQENFLPENDEHSWKFRAFLPAGRKGLLLVEDVSPKSDRVQSIIIYNVCTKTLLINTYFPYRSNDRRWCSSFSQILLALSMKIRSIKLYGLVISMQIFWRNSRFLNIVDEFMTNAGLGKKCLVDSHIWNRYKLLVDSHFWKKWSYSYFCHWSLFLE